jgi:benzylsuccinate CoA-transferase BbsF subunit
VDEVEDTLQSAKVPVHRVVASADASVDPQLAHRQHFLTVDHPELGPIAIENSRFRLSATPAQVTRPGPTFGQDNEYVLREVLGLDDEAVTELVISGALE